MSCAACDAAVDEPVCADCQQRVVGKLGRLPRLYVELRDALPSTRGGSEQPRHSSVIALPLRADVLDLADEMIEVVESWEDAHRKASGFEQRDQFGRPGFRLVVATRYCVQHVAGILTLDAYFADEIAGLSRRALRALGRADNADRLAGICPHCDRAAGLHREYGADWVRCTWCGAGWDRAQHALLVRALLHSEATR